jgi:hypothetical protein
MQSESGKTLMYVAAAVIMAVVGIALAPKGPKAASDGLDGLIGTAFYQDFQDPAEATAIDVIGYDPTTATSTPFSVEYQDGLWRIPTRFNYPADAKDRLAKVGSSIIGLKREALAGRTESEQAEFQVLDPKAEKPDNLKGIGNRVTLRKGNTVLADYIIGKQVPNRAGYYYVRKPGEKQTFIAKVEIDLSTKFTDWIESDVLNLEGTRLTRLNLLRHTLELSPQPHLVGEENSVLSRKTSSEPWTLEGLDEATEEVNQDEVRKVVSALDDLKVVGVRPKPESLRRDLRNEEGIKLDQETAEDLADRGFYILKSSRGGHQMVSKEGDLVAGTDQGVEYEMHFGKVFEGTEEEIELGFAKPAADDDEDRPADATQQDEPKDESAGGKKKSRFIFVTARVNPDLFGPALEEPVKPEPPADKPAEETKAEEKQEGDAKSEEKPKEGEAAAKDESKEDGEQKDEQPAEEKAEATEPAKPDPKAEYEAALKKYEADKTKYESDLKSRDGKVKEAEEKVKALNARFADWYYVISAESFENLRPTRAQLVKAKPDAETKPDDADQPSEEPKEESEEAAAKPDEKKTDEKPADKQPEEKQSDAAKSKTDAPAAKAKK